MTSHKLTFEYLVCNHKDEFEIILSLMDVKDYGKLKVVSKSLNNEFPLEHDVKVFVDKTPSVMALMRIVAKSSQIVATMTIIQRELGFVFLPCYLTFAVMAAKRLDLVKEIINFYDDDVVTAKIAKILGDRNDKNELISRPNTSDKDKVYAHDDDDFASCVEVLSHIPNHGQSYIDELFNEAHESFRYRESNKLLVAISKYSTFNQRRFDYMLRLSMTNPEVADVLLSRGAKIDPEMVKVLKKHIA